MSISERALKVINIVCPVPVVVGFCCYSRLWQVPASWFVNYKQLYYKRVLCPRVPVLGWFVVYTLGWSFTSSGRFVRLEEHEAVVTVRDLADVTGRDLDPGQ